MDEKLKEKMKAPILLIIMIIGFIIYNYNVRTRREKEFNVFKERGVFTIGEVVEYREKIYNSLGGGNSPAYVKFFFKIGGIEYTELSDLDVPDKNGPREGSMFMAIYLPDDPSKCGLLLDFPVKDSSDYKKYIKEFKTKMPEFK